jgi:hypothetical protein
MVVCIMNNSLERKVFMGTLLVSCSQANASKGNYKIIFCEPKIAIGKNIKSLLLKGFDLNLKTIFWTVEAMLLNKDCTIGLWRHKSHCAIIYKKMPMRMK